MANRYNALTAKWLEQNGWTFDKSEQWVSFKGFDKKGFAGIRRDLFQFMDYVAYQEGKGIVGVQSTSYGCHLARRKKILSNSAARGWVRTGGIIFLISWRLGESKKVLKSGKISTRKMWIPRVETILEADFAAESSKPTSIN